MEVQAIKENIGVVAEHVVSPEILGVVGLIVTFAGFLPGLAAEWTVTAAGILIMGMAAMFHSMRPGKKK